jgi:hypothetical protein
MRKAIKVLVVYLLSLLICSLILKWVNLPSYINPLRDARTALFTPMMLIIIAGGIISLKLTVEPRPFKIFLIVYASLWAFRFFVLYLADNINTITVFNKTLHFDIIIPNYYSQVSRLATPLPFVVFWLINYFFSKDILPSSKK